MARALLLLLAAALLPGCNCDLHHREPAVRGLPVDDARAPVSAVWIGHSTVLLRLGDKTILADANFSSHQAIYPRLTDPSIAEDQLPPVDVVLVSHLHADHYDASALRTVGEKAAAIFPAGARAYTPWLPEQLQFLEPWEATEVHGVKVTAVPARHSGGRFFVDGFVNHSFAGYVVEAGGHRAFFAGDTGYDRELFREIGRRLGSIDLAFIPIAPARGGDSAHASPSEALDIFRDLGARFMIPIHFEAFYSAVVPYDEPRRVLGEAVAARGLGQSVFALRTGERWVMPDDGRAPYVTGELPAPTAHEQGLQPAGP